MGQSQRGVTTYLQLFEDDREAFFKASPDLLIVLNGTGDIIRVNPAFETRLDREEKSVIGRPIIVFVYHEDFAIFMRAFQNVLTSKPFRLLHMNHGVVTVRMIWYWFGSTRAGQRGRLILRPIKE